MLNAELSSKSIGSTQKQMQFTRHSFLFFRGASCPGFCCQDNGSTHKYILSYFLGPNTYIISII